MKKGDGSMDLLLV